MIILREYKSVVFWLIFVSLWIVDFLPCCNEKKNDKTEENKSTNDSNELNNSSNSYIDTNNSSDIINKRSFSNQQDIPSMINSKEGIIESNPNNNYKINNSSYNANNNIINNESLQDQLMQQNIENNQINQNNPNFGLFKNIDSFTFQNNNMSDGNNFMQNQGFSTNQNQKKIFENQQIISQNPDNQFNVQPFLANMEIQNGDNMNSFLKQNNNIAMMNNSIPNNQEFLIEQPQTMMNNSMSNNQIFSINQPRNNMTMMYNSPIQNINLIFPQNNIVPPPAEPKEEPISTYDRPTLIGLNNIGATCFMNATLQCFSQTKRLTNYFLKEENKKRIIFSNSKLEDPNQLRLSPYYLELIQNLWDKNGQEAYSPNNFRENLEEMNPLFEKGQARDSKDLVIFMLGQMNKELKDINEVNEPKPDLNQYDKENALKYFFSDFKNNCSIITDIFYGISETNNICLNCKNVYENSGINKPITYNYQTFSCLIFPLEEIKKWKNTSIDNKNQIQNNIVNLYDCFTYYTKDNLHTGGSRFFCNLCNQDYDSLYTTKIYESPNILIIILNRGKGNEFKVNLDFAETIDISNYVIKKEQSKIVYNLYGVITHIGINGPDAHFIASCKSPVDGKWYKYNDAWVAEINDVQNEIIDYETPYILFYEKVK